MQADRNDFYVRLTLSPEQARVVSCALDFFSRIKCGQLGEIGNIFWGATDRDSIREVTSELKRLCLPGLRGSSAEYGISECPDESAKVAWDIMQVVRQTEIKARHPGGPQILVSYDDPMFVSKSEPRPTATAVSILDRLVED